MDIPHFFARLKLTWFWHNYPCLASVRRRPRPAAPAYSPDITITRLLEKLALRCAVSQPILITAQAPGVIEII
jgi:hypothetical protein